MLGCEIVEKSKIAFRARAPGRRNPHSSSSPGKPDTWQRGVGDPMAGTWRDAKCKLPRRSSPSTENVADTEGARPSSSASDATSRSTPDDRRGHTRIRRNQSKDRATGEPDDAKVSSPVRRGADGKGRSRLPVTADAYGLTNPGIRRNLASRLPYEDSRSLKPFRWNPAGNQSRPVELDQQPEASLAWRVGDHPCEAQTARSNAVRLSPEIKTRVEP